MDCACACGFFYKLEKDNQPTALFIVWYFEVKGSNIIFWRQFQGPGGGGARGKRQGRWLVQCVVHINNYYGLSHLLGGCKTEIPNASFSGEEGHKIVIFVVTIKATNHLVFCFVKSKLTESMKKRLKQCLLPGYRRLAWRRAATSTSYHNKKRIAINHWKVIAKNQL